MGIESDFELEIGNAGGGVVIVLVTGIELDCDTRGNDSLSILTA